MAYISPHMSFEAIMWSKEMFYRKFTLQTCLILSHYWISIVISTLGIQKSHMNSSQVNRRLRSHRNVLFIYVEIGALLIWKFLGTIIVHFFRIPNSLVKIWWTVVVDQIQLFTDHSDCQTTIRMHEITDSTNILLVLEDDGLPLRAWYLIFYSSLRKCLKPL